MKNRNYGMWAAAGLLALQACAMDVADEQQISGVGQELARPGQCARPRLLALGDSIAYGYDPFSENFNRKRSFVGYPEILGRHFKVKNASCPGESSASFFSTSALDNGCREFRDDYGLHVRYRGSETQLDYALSRVAKRRNSPDIITLNISGNDIFLLQQSCEFDAVCFQEGLPAMIGALVGNVATIFESLRGAGFDGRLVFLNLYPTSNDPNTLAVVGAINASIANIFPIFDVQVADGFGAFQAAAGGQEPCDAGLLIPLPSGEGCDVHPSRAGAEVLAQAIHDVL